LEQNEASQSHLIPSTETLLESYGDMNAEERNKLLKVILRRIEYAKGEDGKITIDLFPQLPRFEPQEQQQPWASSE
jgi:hypothetical protein